MTTTTVKIAYDEAAMKRSEPRPSVKVMLVKGSMFDHARTFSQNGMEVALHNFANNYRPGLYRVDSAGKIYFGTNTQEEQLLRASMSNNELFLDDAHYPICPDDDENEYTLKSTHVKFTKDTLKGYRTLPTLHYEATVITCALLNLSSRAYDPEFVKENTLKRMILCLNAAADCDVFITGLWGCGAFCHNIPDIIALWKQAFSLTTHLPQEIVFAVYFDIFTNANNEEDVWDMCQAINS
jgi:uncharacterized protein (TIGR02452 family)